MYQDQDFDDEVYIQPEIKDRNLRLGFIRKVFGIISIQLLLSLITIGLMYSQGTAFQQYLVDNIAFFQVALAISFGVEITLFTCGNLAKKTPTNYILLFIFTISFSQMTGCTVCFQDIESVVIATTLTLAATVGLTLQAMQTRDDFTIYGALLFAHAMTSLCIGLLWMCFGGFNSWWQTLICYFGSVVQSLYLIFDVQLVTGDIDGQKSQQTLGQDDYVIGALVIQIDIVILFIRILRIIGKKR